MSLLTDLWRSIFADHSGAVASQVTGLEGEARSRDGVRAGPGPFFLRPLVLLCSFFLGKFFPAYYINIGGTLEHVPAV